MFIRRIDRSETATINKVVAIHIETFTGFFLTFMGKGFLRLMYSAYTTHDNSGLLVAFEDENPVGFLAYSGDMSGLYKHMIKTRLVPFAWYSCGALIRKPKVWFRLIRAFLKPTEAKRTEQYIELSSIGVSPNAKSRGIGSQLIDALKSRVDFSKYMYISLETDAENNGGVNSFYLRNAFKIVHTYETYEKRKMNEYRYAKEM